MQNSNISRERELVALLCLTLLVGPAKVNKVKIFSGLCYIIKLMLKLVLVAQGLVLIRFIGQNKVKIFNKVKICQNRLLIKTSRKKEQKD